MNLYTPLEMRKWVWMVAQYTAGLSGQYAERTIVESASHTNVVCPLELGDLLPQIWCHNILTLHFIKDDTLGDIECLCRVFIG